MRWGMEWAAGMRGYAAGAMNRSTSPPFWGGIRDGAVLRLHVAAARLRLRRARRCFAFFASVPYDTLPTETPHTQKTAGRGMTE